MSDPGDDEQRSVVPRRTEPPDRTLRRIEADVENIAQLLRESEGQSGDARLMEVRRLLELARRASFSGPLPPPEILEGYKAAYPEAPGLIFHELQEQGAHRRKMEWHALSRQEARADRGQMFALVIVLVVLGVTVFSIIKGQGWVGASLFGVTLVAIVGQFIIGTRRNAADLAGKRERLDEGTKDAPQPPENQPELPLNPPGDPSPS